MKKYGFLLLLLIVSLLLGCVSNLDPSEPPEVHYGEDVCDACNMIISEPRFAAAYYTEDGAVRRFDDIGDMWSIWPLLRRAFLFRRAFSIKK